MRLDKYLTLASIGTRKKVHGLIASGQVSVNGTTMTDATIEVDEVSDRVTCMGRAVTYIGPEYYMMNKPMGCVTAKSDANCKTVMDYFDVPHPEGFFPVGRLDKNTTGLLLVTNDGALDHRLMTPGHHVPKTYRLWATGVLTQEKIRELEAGITLRGETTKTRPARIKLLKAGEYTSYREEIDAVKFPEVSIHVKETDYSQPVFCAELTITEGKKHQVKRMMKAVECAVIALKRTAIGDLRLDEELETGQYKRLEKEMNIFGRIDLTFNGINTII